MVNKAWNNKPYPANIFVQKMFSAYFVSCLSGLFDHGSKYFMNPDHAGHNFMNPDHARIQKFFSEGVQLLFFS